MTTNTTPSSTGSASSRRRATNVSTAATLLVDPHLSEPEVVLDGVDGEALDVGPGHHDLLGVVDRDTHHLPGQDVMGLAVEIIALGLVEVAPGLPITGDDTRC